MKDEDLSLKIAEYLEPKDSLERHIPPKYWRVEWDDAGKTRYFIEPRSFRTDPAMRDLLQAKLLEGGWQIRIGRHKEGTFYLTMNQSFEPSTWIEIETTNREGLWSEAFARAKGLI